MSDEMLQVTVDKFTFQVKPGLLYTQDGVWLALDKAKQVARVGLTDFRQQSSGDLAFVDLPQIGQAVAQGDDLADIETVKVDLAISAPCDGKIVAINEALAETPELINQDPYGAGWLVELQPVDWPVEGLLDAQAHLVVMTQQAQEASR
jgi:glycine cleavage system H protein